MKKRTNDCECRIELKIPPVQRTYYVILAEH